MVKPPRIRTAFFSVVPSPYQRDLFRALATRDEIDLRVFYLEKRVPDSPWPERPLADFESILPGFAFPVGRARVQWNWGLPDLRPFDVVVCNTLMSMTAQWLMRGPLRPHRWLFWGEKLGPRSWKHDRLTRPLHRATAIAAIGSRAVRDYQTRFPGVPVHDIPYHCDLSAFRAAPRQSDSEGTITFFFCGQMIARKGLDLLLTAFAQMPSHCRLLLVGREAELPSMLATLNPAVRARVEYAGFQAPEALPAYFARADAFVLPSRYDGWGVVVNQALGAGLAIVVTDEVGAGYDLVTPGKNGLVCRADDADSLRDAMRELISDKDRLRTWGETSRATSVAWDPASGAQKWISTLQQVVA